MEVYPHPENGKLNIEIRLASNHSIFLPSESANKLAVDILKVIHEYEARAEQTPVQKPQLPVYDNFQTLNEVLALGNDSKIILAIHTRISKKIVSFSYEALSPVEKIIHTVCGLEAEVNNGGLDQYFFNADGNHALDAVAALESIGAPRMKRILEKAIEVFPNRKIPIDQSERRALLQKFSKNQSNTLSKLDSEFLKYPDDLGHLLVLYIKNYQNDISWE